MSDSLAKLLAKAQAKGANADFHAWVQRQPSCLSGQYSEYLESGEGRNPACHIRRAGESGTGYKASYAVIPLTHQEHQRQHIQGETALLNAAKPKPGGWTVQEAKDWFDAQRLEYLRMWLDS